MYSSSSMRGPRRAANGRNGALTLIAMMTSIAAHAVDYRDLPQDRFPPAGWDDLAWIDPGGWTVVDVSDAGISPGSSTVAADLQALMDDASVPSIFFFPSGDYNIEATLEVPSRAIIRGAGAGQTRFLLGAAAGPITFSGDYDAASETLTADVAPGATEIPVADGSAFSTGDLVRVDQELPAWAESWGARSHGQVVFVTGVVGDTLQVDMPLALPYRTAASAQAHAMNLVEDAGIERLTLERTVHNDEETIFIKRAYNVFVRHLESYNTAKIHVYVARARRVVVTGNYIHHAWDYGGGGHGYGVDLMETSTRCLVTDNVFETLRHHLIYATGANHCVVAYNLNVDIENPDDILADVCGHGHWKNHNLIEGNVAWWYYIDNVWGPAGPENTFFRNRAQGKLGSWHQGEGVTIIEDSDRQNVIANLLDNGSSLFFGAEVDDLFVEGNVVQGTPAWSSLPSDADLPPSLYLDQPPAFWPADLAWPPFGPDVTDAAQNKIPAQLRYERGEPVAGWVILDAGIPDRGQTDRGAPDVGAGDRGQTDTARPDAPQPDSPRSDSGQTDASQPDTARPDRDEPDAGSSPSVFSPIPEYGDRRSYTELNPSRWSVVEDQGDLRYFLNTSDYDALSGSRLGERALVRDESYLQFELAVRARSPEELTANPAADLCLVFDYQDEENYAYAMLNARVGYSQLFRVVAGQRRDVGDTAQAPLVDSQYHHVVLRRHGGRVTLHIDGELQLDSPDAEFGSSPGAVGVGSLNDSVYFDDIEVTIPATVDAGARDVAVPDSPGGADRAVGDAAGPADSMAGVDALDMPDAADLRDRATPTDIVVRIDGRGTEESDTGYIEAQSDDACACHQRSSGGQPAPLLALLLAIGAAGRHRDRRRHP